MILADRGISIDPEYRSLGARVESAFNSCAKGAKLAHPIFLDIRRSELREELCGPLLDLHAQLGFTLVYVTHSKEEMGRIGSRAIRLHECKAVQA